jgi:hypothetical protein
LPETREKDEKKGRECGKFWADLCFSVFLWGSLFDGATLHCCSLAFAGLRRKEFFKSRKNRGAMCLPLLEFFFVEQI